MDAFKKFRYDFFGEVLSDDSDFETDANCADNANSMNQDNLPNQFQALNKGDGKMPEDSLMEFITDYFQGNVTEDFSDSAQEQIENQYSPEGMNAFDSYSSSDMNTSVDMFTSPDTSALNTDNVTGDFRNISSSDFQSPVVGNQYQEPPSRRKSISYEIVFTNTKEKDGKLKIHIVPNKPKTPLPTPTSKQEEKKHVNLPGQEKHCKSKQTNTELTLEQENVWLHQRVKDLERRIRCLETESERVIGELSRIIERKNDTISKLELQIAGVRIET